MKFDKKKLIIIGVVAAVVVAAIVLVFVLLSDKNVKTTVPIEYKDGFAEKYAYEVSVEGDDSSVYEFTPEKYEQFLTDYQEVIKEESRQELATPHQYTHYNLKDSDDKENYGIVIGISEEDYKKAGDDKLKAEAEEIAKAAVKYQMNTADPADSIPVKYRDASTGVVYLTVEIPVA